MFDENFYIDYIKVYIDGQHSVAYIDAHYDDPENPLIFKDGQYDLGDYVEPFNKENIYSIYNKPIGSMPIAGINAEIFNEENVFSNFVFEDNMLPYAWKLVDNFNASNIYSIFLTAEDLLPTSHEIPREMNYNGVYTVFLQAEDEFCCDFGIYPEPFDTYGVWSIFAIQPKFYNLPAAYRELQDPLLPIHEDWRRLDPQYVEHYINISVSDHTHTITSEPSQPYVKDRDLHREEYKAYQDIYREFELQS